MSEERHTTPCILEILSDFDYNARVVLGSRELPTTYKRSFSDRRPYPVVHPYRLVLGLNPVSGWKK